MLNFVFAAMVVVGCIVASGLMIVGLSDAIQSKNNSYITVASSVTMLWFGLVTWILIRLYLAYFGGL